MLNGSAHWRIPTSAKTAFAHGEAGRPLRIVIDDTTAPDCAATRLLYAFGGRSGAEVYGTSAERASRVVIGAPHAGGVIPVSYKLPGGAGRRMAVMSSNDWINASARTTAAELGVSIEEAVRSLTLAAACSRHEIDALVTASPVLALPHWRNLAEKAQAGAPEPAAALLGLYLRAHNDYTVEMDGAHSTFLEDRRFYPAAAVAALPWYFAWLGGAVATWRTRSDPLPFALVKGLSVRLGRALRARDYFNVRVRSPHPEDAWDEALFFFESVLMSLNGALDVAARFCHLTYRLSGSVRSASWSSAKWRQELVAMAPEFEGLADPNTGRLVQIRTLVSVLRNYIHGEALTEELHSGGSQGPTTMVYGLGALAVAPNDGRRLLTAASSLGGAEVWGLQEQFNEDMLVLPARFLQCIVPKVFGVLHELMMISSPRVGPAAGEPPLDPAYWLPDVGHEQQVRLLAGLDGVSR